MMLSFGFDLKLWPPQLELSAGFDRTPRRDPDDDDDVIRLDRRRI